MPIVDLDDELSIVDEKAEEETLEPPMNAFSDIDVSIYSGMKSDMSAMDEMSAMGSGAASHADSQDEREEQWLIDSILNHQDGNSPRPAAAVVSGSETDDSSLYLADMDNLEDGTKQTTPKTKNKKAAPSPKDVEYRNYMDVSGIIDDFGEEKEEPGWRKKVASSLKSKKQPQEKAKPKKPKAVEEAKPKKTLRRKSTNGSDKEEAKPVESKESWKNKNPFRGKNSKKSQDKPAASDETNLAPLANFDDVSATKEEDKKEGWMPKISFLGKTTAEEEPKKDDYAANLAPLGAVSDVEANHVDEVVNESKPPEAQGSWSTRMTSFISTITETKQEPEEEDENPDDTKSTTSSVGLTDSINLVNDIVASLTEKTPEDNQEIDEEKGVVTQESKDNVTEEVKEEEGSFVGSDENGASEETVDDMVTALVGDSDQTEVQEGSDDTTDPKKTWKSKVKSVRKKSSSKLSSIRNSGKSKLSKKSFTQDKMKELDAASDDKTVETKHTDSSLDGNKAACERADKRKKVAGLVILSILFVALIIGVTVGLTKRGSSDDTSVEVPPERLEYLYRLLFPISGNDLEVEDPEAPLVKAFIWTAKDSVLRSDSDEEIIARYATAAVYHSLGGEKWTNQNNFLSHDSLCTWNDAGYSGIICSDSQTMELKLGKYAMRGITLAHT